MIGNNRVTPKDVVFEPAREVPVVWEGDLCVIGGSCTGVFAAVRAARLGLRVAVVENQTIFGGMATAARVNEWHSTYDVANEKQIIAGLTMEVVERLSKRDAVIERARDERTQYVLDPAALALELDVLVRENGVRPFLAARCVGGVREEGVVRAAFIEDKSGRRALRARYFIDASGDGDLLRRVGFEAYQNEKLQPVNLQAVVAGFPEFSGEELTNLIQQNAEKFGYPIANSKPWAARLPGMPDLRNVFGPRLNGVDASDADQLTEALMASRRCFRDFADMVKSVNGSNLRVVAWAQALGVRETWHARCRYQLTGRDLLEGVEFPDSIACGKYPIDIHSETGTSLRYLDGREESISPDGSGVWSRWREESLSPDCYHVPYRSLVPRDAENLLVAGRLLDADREAFGGVRVMVNCNQMGEAVGVASALALQDGHSVADVDAADLRNALVAGGSAPTLVPGSP